MSTVLPTMSAGIAAGPSSEIDLADSSFAASASSSSAVKPATKAAAPRAAAKKPTGTAASKSKSKKEKEVFDEDGPIYDDCNEIRRKIRAHLAEGNKITHFLKELGGINNNSYQRFMALKGPDGGSANGTYSSAYYFFQKKRIEAGKPKSKKRKDAEAMNGGEGYSTDRRSGTWVRVGPGLY